jgi:hypothetical protein
MCSGFDPLPVLLPPTMRRRNESGSWHLNVDQHGVIRSIKAKASHERQQVAVVLGGTVAVSEPKELVECVTGPFDVER